MPNTAQIEKWDGPSGEHWAAEAARYDRLNQAFADRIVDVLAPQPGEAVLDVGCGNGALSLAIAPRVGPDGSVIGLDISSPMLGVARARAAEVGLTNVTFEKGDAQLHPLPDATFDGLVSRFGVMFFDDPTAAFTNLGRALKPGGRMAFACWQALPSNDWLMVPFGAALQHVPMPDLGPPESPGPFSLADPDTIRTMLDRAGFVDVDLEAVTRPMLLGASPDDAVWFLQRTDIAQGLMKDVDEPTAARAWAAVRDALASHLTERGVELNGTAWLVSGRRP
jgi:SAM-dependent methyltransferase